MGNWKFLLQKKGDRDQKERTSRSWQELKTHSVEIEEGKYRLLGQSNYFHCPGEICLNYQINPSDRALSYSLKYYRKTNEEGLIEISPFFYFHPGVWEITCCSDIFSEMVGEFWQENLQLKVLSTNQAKLFKNTKKIDLFYPQQSKIKCRETIALAGQIFPPKITNYSTAAREIKLPSIEI